jgi:hypothetical protein
MEQQMYLGKRIKNPDVLIRVGLVFMVLANLSSWLLRRAFLSLSENITDVVMGLLFGVTIASLLLGIWLKSRGRPTPNAGCPCPRHD